MCFDICLNLACFCFKKCCNDVCRLAKQVCGISLRQQIKFAYLSLYVFFIFLTLGLMFITPYTLGIWSTFIHCPVESGGDLICFGISAVYRMSFTLASLFLIIFLICLCRNDCSRMINEDFWCLKIFYVISVFISLMFIPNQFFVDYSHVSRWASGGFLIFQVLMIIDLFYYLGEKLVAIYDSGVNYFAYMLIALALIFYSVSTFIIIKSYQFFPCNQGTITSIVVLVVVITLLTISGIAQNGSLITSGAMSMYVCYQLWSSLSNERETECNKMLDSKNFFAEIEIFFDFFIIISSLGYVAFKSNKQKKEENNISFDRMDKLSDEENDQDFIEDFSSKKKIEMQNIELKKINNQSDGDLQLQRQRQRLKDYQQNIFINFHLIMMLSSIYICMMLTNWGSPKISDKTQNSFELNNNSKWIKIICCWVASALYIWTLIVQRIFPDRVYN